VKNRFRLSNESMTTKVKSLKKKMLNQISYSIIIIVYYIVLLYPFRYLSRLFAQKSLLTLISLTLIERLLYLWVVHSKKAEPK
jgi:hypothetical protein